MTNSEGCGLELGVVGDKLIDGWAWDWESGGESGGF